VALIFVAGALSDRYGRRVVYGLGTAAAAIWLWQLFPMLESKSPALVVAAFAVGMAVHALMYGPQGAFIAEQFPARVRFAGSSIAYTFAGVFAGGIAPLAFTKIFAATRQTGLIVLYAAAALIVTVLALLAARPRGREL
jgi:MFS family permease